MSMASKMNKKFSCDIKGLVSIEGDKILISVEDIDDEINLAEYVKDFNNKDDVKISFAYGEELA